MSVLQNRPVMHCQRRYSQASELNVDNWNDNCEAIMSSWPANRVRAWNLDSLFTLFAEKVTLEADEN